MSSKAIRFGAAAVLALATSGSALAGEEKSHAKATRDRPSTSARATPVKTEVAPVVKTASTWGAVADAKKATDSKAERASFDERWLQDREGYRDGGY